MFVCLYVCMYMSVLSLTGECTVCVVSRNLIERCCGFFLLFCSRQWINYARL